MGPNPNHKQPPTRTILLLVLVLLSSLQTPLCLSSLARSFFLTMATEAWLAAVTSTIDIEDIKQFARKLDDAKSTIQGKHYRVRRHQAEAVYKKNGGTMSDSDINCCLGWLVPNDWRDAQTYLDTAVADARKGSHEAAKLAIVCYMLVSSGKAC